MGELGKSLTFQILLKSLLIIIQLQITKLYVKNNTSRSSTKKLRFFLKPNWFGPNMRELFVFGYIWQHLTECLIIPDDFLVQSLGLGSTNQMLGLAFAGISTDRFLQLGFHAEIMTQHFQGNENPYMNGS